MHRNQASKHTVRIIEHEKVAAIKIKKMGSNFFVVVRLAVHVSNFHNNKIRLKGELHIRFREKYELKKCL